ncbi:ribonuclease domain-containing protein [Limnohabitans sp.]|jgi:ribonuclease T1|uniref:ribonuclease domain-containing protein n=1 Tax=Limnohabitans sp. TaxID=1907725 RepID=UPI0037BFFAF2
MRVGQQAWARRWWFATLMGFILAACTFLVQAKPPSEVQVQATIQRHEMPREGQETYRLIHLGGPFPYEKDGTVFGNRERLLPRHNRGFYREYTVRTPGVRHRGARRIVCGGQVPTQPKTCYYTQDHYASFRLIVE